MERNRGCEAMGIDKTVDEIAREWNITSGHVQYLCRQGKIEGAKKRASVWFIPDDAPIPIKNTKSGEQGFMFFGTKKKVFDSAIELFMLRGFNSVSIKEIADHVGVRQSSIYNHFSSKQQMLDTIYEFYCHHYRKDRKSVEEMDVIIEKESPLAIIEAMHYDFGTDYAKRMSDITKIIFQRIVIDEHARQIVKSLMIDEGIQYVKEVFDRAVQSGRFAPFDTHALALFVNSIRMFTLYNWIIDSSMDTMIKLVEDEKTLYQYAVALLKDLKPSETNDAKA